MKTPVFILLPLSLLYVVLVVGLRGQTNWVTQNLTATTLGSSITDVTFGAGRYVGVGTGGLVMTSSDGDSWTRRTVPNVTQTLSAVTAGNGLFVAAGDSGRVITSADGVSWSTPVVATAARLNAAAYGNGIFAAVGEGGTIITSTDGVRWILRDSRGTTTSLRTIIYTGGGFIAAGDAGRFLTSTDGVSWSLTIVSSLTRGIRALVSAKGLLVALVFGSDADEVWSASAVNGLWTRTKVPLVLLSGITYGSRGFVVTGYGGTVYISQNGVDWGSTQLGPNAPLGFYRTAFAANRYLAFGISGIVYYSAVPFGSTPVVIVPPLLPPGVIQKESRALAEQYRGSVIVAVSGLAPTTRLAGGPPTAGLYTNPQPYNLSQVVRLLNSGQPDPGFASSPGADGTVNTIAIQPDGKILVGGTFQIFSNVLFNNIARLNPDGDPDNTFSIGSGPSTPRGSAQVNAIAVNSDGSILVGGAFTLFQGKDLPYIAKIKPDGAVDESFAPILNGPVNAIKVQPDGNILVGGAFTTIGRSPLSRSRIVRLQPGGAVDMSFDPGTGANGEVVALALQPNGAILVGGDFTLFRGDNRYRLVRLSSSGLIDPSFSMPAPEVDDTVICIGLQNDGKILIGGSFKSVNKTERIRVARLNSNGALDLTFDAGPGANNDVRAVLPRGDGSIFFSGLFDQFGGQPANQVVEVGGAPAEISINRSPQPVNARPGDTATFEVSASAAGLLAYQWFKDGNSINGATGATLTLSSLTASAEGRYSVRISSGGYFLDSDTVTLSVRSSSNRVINLSVRAEIEEQDSSFTLGFVTGGTGTSGTMPVLVRAVGPSLENFGVRNPLSDPKLRFYSGVIRAGENDDWGGTAALAALNARVGAFPLPPNSKDAVYAPANLFNGMNSVEVYASPGARGTVLAEVYDATAASAVRASSPRLINVSVLKRIPVGGKVTAGFVVGTGPPMRVLVRAIGPSLATQNVAGFLPDPTLAFYRLGEGTPMQSNDNWGGVDSLKSAFAAVGAFPLDPGSRDSALVLTLPAGGYTAEAAGANILSGVVLVEIYELP